MQVQSITQLFTTKPLKRLLPLVCSATLWGGIVANAQEGNNHYNLQKDTTEFVKDTNMVAEKTQVQNHKKSKTLNLSERISPSLSGECDYVYGSNTTLSTTIGGNNMLVDNKTGSFVNLFLGGSLAEDKKASAVALLCSEVFFPQPNWSVRGRTIGMLGANNLLAVDMPTPRYTISVNPSKTIKVMLQPMLRYLHTKESDAWKPGFMLNSSFPYPINIQPQQQKKAKKKPAAYFEAYLQYDLKTKNPELSGFLAIPF